MVARKRDCALRAVDGAHMARVRVARVRDYVAHGHAAAQLQRLARCAHTVEHDRGRDGLGETAWHADVIFVIIFIAIHVAANVLIVVANTSASIVVVVFVYIVIFDIVIVVIFDVIVVIV